MFSLSPIASSEAPPFPGRSQTGLFVFHDKGGVGIRPARRRGGGCLIACGKTQRIGAFNQRLLRREGRAVRLQR